MQQNFNIFSTWNSSSYSFFANSSILDIGWLFPTICFLVPKLGTEDAGALESFFFWLLFLFLLLLFPCPLFGPALPPAFAVNACPLTCLLVQQPTSLWPCEPHLLQILLNTARANSFPCSLFLVPCSCLRHCQ